MGETHDCQVTYVNADKRQIEVHLQVKGLSYEINHFHYSDGDGFTEIKAIDHERHCKLITEEHCKYYFKGVFEIDGVDVEIHRTYDTGCFMSVNGGEPEKTVGKIDEQEWVNVRGVAREII